MGSNGGAKVADAEMFTAIAGYTDPGGAGSFIVYGGSAKSTYVQKEPFSGRTGAVAVVARMDLDTNAVRFKR